MLGAAVLVSLRTFRMLLLLCTNSLMLKSSGDDSISSLQPITALMGDDVILPCGLKNPTDVRSKTVVWTKPGLDPKFIHVYQSGRLVHQVQHPSYRYRTTLFEDQLANGNVSLKLFRVKISDAGTYVCSIQSMGTRASVQLSVGAASSPVIGLAKFDRDDGRLVLRCQSTGWRPQPGLSWLDSEGHVLPAGPTETLRGPGDLYSVSSTLTVDERDVNRFTCRVQQKDINQTRETHVQLPAHLNTSSCWTWLWVVGGVSAVLILLIIYILIMKKRINYSGGQKSTSDQSPKHANSESSLQRIQDDTIRKATAEKEKRKAVSKPPQPPSLQLPSNNSPKPVASTSTSKPPKSGSSVQNEDSKPLLPKKNAASGSSTLKSKHTSPALLTGCVAAPSGSSSSSSSASTPGQSHAFRPRTLSEPWPRPGGARPQFGNASYNRYSLLETLGDDMEVDSKQ